MSLGDRYARGFASPTARARVAEAVRAIEATTGAEVVVAVRAVSGEYTEADYRFGTVAGFAALLAFLFYPYEFDTNLFPLIYATTFVAATLLVRRAPPLRRLFVGAARARRAVELAARGELVGLGITRTRERTGLLVYVSIFERRVADVARAGESDLGQADRHRRHDIAGRVGWVTSRGRARHTLAHRRWCGCGDRFYGGAVLCDGGIRAQRVARSGEDGRAAQLLGVAAGAGDGASSGASAKRLSAISEVCQPRETTT